MSFVFPWIHHISIFRNRNEDDDTVHQYLDVTTLADPLQAPDSVDPQDLYHSICDLPNSEIGQDRYEQLPKEMVKLSSLKALYDNKRVNTALARLHRRSTLVIDKEYTVSMNDPGYAFSCRKSYLDFILVVGKDVGIDMFIPNVLVDHSFAIDLNLKLQIKPFTAKLGTLGFDPSSAMLCLGETPVANLFVGMAPNGFFSQAEPPFRLDEGYGDTRMSRTHYHILVIFMATILSKLEGRNFYIFQPFDLDPTHIGLEHLKTETNVLYVHFLVYRSGLGRSPFTVLVSSTCSRGRAIDVTRSEVVFLFFVKRFKPDEFDIHIPSDNPTIHLPLDDLKILNTLIKVDWPGFVRNAPTSWKKDKWITTRSPVGIISSHGQNQPMATSGNGLERERTSWRESRDYSKARWLSYAAATHYE